MTNVSTQPATIARYEVVRRLAQGGMGALYLAWDPRLDRQIAIKLLMHDDDELRERFAREARSAARLRHPHIVTIFDVGEHDGRPFIAMEYIQGQTLAAMVRTRTELPLARKLKLAEELCEGIGFAHKAGVIHRDVKPANAIVDAHGALKILDFGIARLGDSSGMTQAGMLMGTLNYMSPEQMLGRPADSRSDIFAVGAVVYELLAYRQAFPGGIESGVITRIIQATPEPLDQICAALDPDIVRIVNRALAKEPAERYQDLAQMGQELQRARQRLDRDGHAVDVEVPAPTPTPSGSATVRRAADREELARRRLAQIQSHLDAASDALACGDADVAVARCEEALLLDADHPAAVAMFERARAAQDERQAETLLGDAEAHIRLGALTAAQVLIERAGALSGSSVRVASMRQMVDEALRAREQARRRAESIGRLLDRANGAFDWGDFEGAIEAAESALAEQPDLASAQLIRQRAEAALAARERNRTAATKPVVDTGAFDRTLLIAPSAAASLPGSQMESVAQPAVSVPEVNPITPTLQRLRVQVGEQLSRFRPIWLGAGATVMAVGVIGLLWFSSGDAAAVVSQERARAAARLADEVTRQGVDARRLLAAGELIRAAETASAGLALRQDDSELIAITGDVLAAVRSQMDAARAEAAPFAGTKRPRELALAEERRAEFATQSNAGRTREAVVAGLDATARFNAFADARRTSEERRLAQERREQAEKARLEEAERERLAIERTWAERDAIARQIAEAEAKKRNEEMARTTEERARREAEEQARQEEAARTERAAAAERARLAKLEEDRRIEAERAAARVNAAREADRRAVDVVLQTYVQAYTDRSASAVKRVFPSADDRVLANRFAELRSQRVNVANPTVEIDGESAIVSGQWVVDSVDMFGQQQKGSVPFRLRLQKSGDAWVILARQ